MKDDKQTGNELDTREVRTGRHPGDRYVRVTHNPDFQRLSPDFLSVTPRAAEPKTALGRARRRIRRLLIGTPIETERESHERLSKLKALAVFGSDNVSSSAYATEEMMRILLLAGLGALTFTLPLTIAIVVVLVIVVISYQQTIRAYPKGASAYLVASGELGKLPGLTAAASLLNDYVLTVSVSIAAGVAALSSMSPFFFENRVIVGVLLIMLIALGNLRGIRESGSIFAAPTYIYSVSVFGLLVYGMYLYFTGTLPTYTAPPEWNRELQEEAVGALSILLVLRAFASGAVGLSGTEAISDGVPAFKPAEDRNARITLLMMAGIFGTLFLGISFLSAQLAIVPDPSEARTVLSQLVASLVGSGPYFWLVQVSTAVILVLAANTAFADFPRLSYFLARDSYLPHQFTHRGDRLAFSTGILALAVVAGILLVLFSGSVTALIPLYTLGVFTAFTLSQSGMVAHWRRQRGPGWKWKAAINGLGAAITATVALVVAVTKFAAGQEMFRINGFPIHAGAWMVMVVVPVTILGLIAIERHYSRSGTELQTETPLSPSDIHHTIIVPIAQVNRVALQSLAYARSITPNVTAVHIAENAEEAERWRLDWVKYEGYGRLEVIVSPYRSLVSPILSYIDAVDRKQSGDTLTIILPEFVAKHWWERALHNQTALRLKTALLFRPGTVVTNVPYHLRD